MSELKTLQVSSVIHEWQTYDTSSNVHKRHSATLTYNPETLRHEARVTINGEGRLLVGYFPTSEEAQAATATSQVLHEILVERARQTQKWGQQNWPLTHDHLSAEHHGQKADTYKATNDLEAKTGKLHWDNILLEEAHEAFAETDPVKAREELVQVAAVAVAAIESLDRNELAGRS